VAADFSPYLTDLGERVQRTRDNFEATAERFDGLREKMTREATSSAHDPGTQNRMYTRQGYLYAQSKTKLGTTQWTRHFCQYSARTRVLTLLPYNQAATGKISAAESVRVTDVECREDTSTNPTVSPPLEGKYRFVVNGEDEQVSWEKSRISDC